MNGLGVIDVDSHVTEPPDVWTSRVASKWGDLVPHVEWSDESAKGDGQGEFAWFIGDNKIASAYASACAGFDGTFPDYARRPEETHAAAWDPQERVKILDEGGIARQALFGNVGGFGSEGFLKLGEPELMTACLQAYNDFILDFASAAPDRFIPIAVAPMWDVELAVKEVYRTVGAGHKAIAFTGAPHEFGLPRLGTPHWEPLWEAIEECDVPLSFHIGSGDLSKSFNLELLMVEGLTTMYARTAGEMFLDIAQQVNALLFSGILVRHPRLRFVAAESGIGWVPFLLDAADYHFLRGGVRKERPDFTELPSHYFREQCFVTYWFEDLPPEVFEQVGIDNIMFETDFPHPTCLWREEVGTHIERGLAGLSDDARNKILRDNAVRAFKL